MRFTYYIEKSGEFEPFLTYKSPERIGLDEIYARQLCGFLVVNGKEYKINSSEMDGADEVIVLKELGPAQQFSEEKNYKHLGLHIEFREYRPYGDMPLLKLLSCSTHWEVIRYLLKDIVDIPGFGQYETDSTEIDEDRNAYVVYVNKLKNM